MPLKIEDFCKMPNEGGWETIPFIPIDDMLIFLRRDGVQLSASIKMDQKRVIHASISPMRSLRSDLSDEEHRSYLIEQADAVLQAFFENLDFKQQPCDPVNPHHLHYYAEI